MTEKIDEQEIKEGKKQLEGVIVLCWILAIILGLSLISNLWTQQLEIFREDIWKGGMGFRFVFSMLSGLAGIPFKMIYSLLAPALYAVELVGIYQRKSFAVPLGRTVLVLTMIFLFPVGTIAGAILWKRFNNPASKKYLNYEEEAASK